MWKIKISSPAKINLHLDVYNPGKNGFHELRSLFIMVSLFDTLVIEEKKEESCRIVSDMDLPLEENILYRTWLLCRENHLYEKGLEIHLDKKIPQGAGLGGGSGNAASLLRVLHGRNPLVKPFAYWKDMSAELGSDVPFFMESTAAVVSGRGEQIGAVNSRTDFFILIVYPDISIATPGAFSSLDKYREIHGKAQWGLTLDQIKKSFQNECPRDWPFYNSFTPSVYEEYPQLKKIEDTLLTNGADFAILSGSGSAMVGIFRTEEALSGAKRNLSLDFTSTYAVIPLDIIPYGIVI